MGRRRKRGSAKVTFGSLGLDALCTASASRMRKEERFPHLQSSSPLSKAPFDLSNSLPPPRFSLLAPCLPSRRHLRFRLARLTSREARQVFAPTRLARYYSTALAQLLSCRLNRFEVSFHSSSSADETCRSLVPTATMYSRARCCCCGVRGEGTRVCSARATQAGSSSTTSAHSRRRVRAYSSPNIVLQTTNDHRTNNMAKKKGSKKKPSASTSVPPSPSAPNYFDRLAPELKIQILECCHDLGGKRLVIPLASTSNDFRRLGEPLIFGVSWLLPSQPVHR